MRFDVLDPLDPAWGAVLREVPHDVYHLPGYALVVESQEHVKVRLAVVSEGDMRLAAPFMVKSIPASLGADNILVDITVPYGYPGPVCSSDDVNVQRDGILALLEGFRALGAISVFVRCHPFVGVSLDSLRPYGDVVVHGDQVYLDVPELPEDVVSAFRRDHRYNISTALRAGYSLRIDDDSDYETFPDLYRENMRRVGASEYYLFDDAYFKRMRSLLRENLHLVTVVGPEGDTAAQSMMFACGTIGQYHLAGTSARHLKAAPQKLGILGMIRLSQELGIIQFNLGGGVGGQDDSLFEFKAGFSSSRKPFATARFILDEQRYANLSSGGCAPAGFFPAYRHGL